MALCTLAYTAIAAGANIQRAAESTKSKTAPKGRRASNSPRGTQARGSPCSFTVTVLPGGVVICMRCS